MGKSNRIRSGRANAVLTSVKPHKKKQGMPSWAINLITILVVVLLLASVCLNLMIANGVFTRMQTAIKSEHYRVNANMMNYYFKAQYNSFVSENSSYLSYYGLDTSLSLKEQYVNGSDDEDGTWFDYMMNQTTSQVEEILAYCEEAKARDIELDDDDIAEIDEELAMYETYANMYGYTTNSYIATIYGKGMKEKDIRNALKLSALATKCSEELGEELEAAITDDDINGEYASNKLDYDLVDYSSYTFTVNYDDVVAEVLGKDDYTDDEVNEKKDEIIAAYKDKIAEAKNNAEFISKAANKGTFDALVISYIVEDVYDSNYDDVIKDGDIVEADLPSAEDTESIRTALISYIAGIVKSGEELDGENVVVDGKIVTTEISVTEAYATAVKDMAEDIAETAKTKLEATYNAGTGYDDTDDALMWAFEEDRKEGDGKTFEEGDGADGAEISASDELDSFTVSVYVISKPRYRSEILTRNVGIMVFTSEDGAKSAIDKLYEGIGISEFEDICDELGGAFTDYENYTKDALGVDAFDEWLYGDTVKVGSYTAEVIVISSDDSQYAVALYYEDGDAEWYVAVKSAIFNDKYEVAADEIKEKYELTKKDKVIAKIDG